MLARCNRVRAKRKEWYPIELLEAYLAADNKDSLIFSNVVAAISMILVLIISCLAVVHFRNYLDSKGTVNSKHQKCLLHSFIVSTKADGRHKLRSS